MTTTITWKVDSVEAKVSENEFSNVISTIHWRVNGTRDKYISTRYGSITVPSPTDKENFKPFENLTEAEVLGWVKDMLGEQEVENIEASLNAELDNLINPSVISPMLPWATV